jgi:chromatin assembly factor 1 subunit B
MKLYGDESFTNFFRRLTFSPDGGLLLTPAGQFEDPSVTVAPIKKTDGESTRGRKSAGKPSVGANSGEGVNPTSSSSVFVYSRANFARPPIAQLPGHKKASVAIKFSPILYELRQGVLGAESPAEPKTIIVEKGKEESVAIDMVGHDSTPAPGLGFGMDGVSPSVPPLVTPSLTTMPSPALSAIDSGVPTTPSRSKLLSPAIPPTSTGSVFALPYRMLFAIATMDTVTIHDTQQAGPICLLTKLHYDEFTDMTW